METDEMLREEFEKKYFHGDFDYLTDEDINHELVADYWLDILHSRDTAIREAVENVRPVLDLKNGDRVILKSDVIKLLTNKE